MNKIVAQFGVILEPSGHKEYPWKNIEGMGYVILYQIDENKKLLKNKAEHRFILEKYLCRELEDGEIPHHIDENKLNNDLINIELCLKFVHSSYHAKKRYAELRIIS